MAYCRRDGGSKVTLKEILITPADSIQSVRETLRRTDDPYLLITLPWEVEQGWNRQLGYDVLYREALRKNRTVIWIVEDPAFLEYPKAAGFPVFSSREQAMESIRQHGTFPALKATPRPPAPRRPWWADAPEPRKRTPRPQPFWLFWVKLGVLVFVLFVFGFTTFLIGPSAKIILTPKGTVYRVVVPVSLDMEAPEVDLTKGIVPSRVVQVPVEAYAEVSATGIGTTASGKSKGTVVFTNMLGQDYRVPVGTIVRSTATSYPVRFATTEEVTAPPFGQVAASVQALEEGTAGNISASQINLVEGVPGVALRVTNPAPISGAESAEVPMIAEADQENVRKIATQLALAQAYTPLNEALGPGEYMPRQALTAQSFPKLDYTHLVGEQAPTLGLTLGLYASGQSLQLADAQAIAYHALASHVPKEFTLTDARFEYGEAAEEDVDINAVTTFYVTAYGYASAEINTRRVWNSIKGQPIDKARQTLANDLPLARPPEIKIEPSWFPFIPSLLLRTEIQIVPNEVDTQ